MKDFRQATHTKNGTPVQNIKPNNSKGYYGEIQVLQPGSINPPFLEWIPARWLKNGENSNQYLSPHEDLVLPEEDKKGEKESE